MTILISENDLTTEVCLELTISVEEILFLRHSRIASSSRYYHVNSWSVTPCIIVKSQKSLSHAHTLNLNLSQRFNQAEIYNSLGMLLLNCSFSLSQAHPTVHPHAPASSGFRSLWTGVLLWERQAWPASRV